MATNRVTHVQFFHLCEVLRNHRETVESSCFSISETIAVIASKVDFIVSSTTMEEALKTVGITLTKKRSNAKYSEGKRIKTARVLAKSLTMLFAKLGEPIPNDLQELCERLDNGIGISTGEPVLTRPVLTIPVKTVPKPETIPVVNNKR